MDQKPELALIRIDIQGDTVTMALKRMGDARRDGDTVLCPLRELGNGWHEDIESLFSRTLDSEQKFDTELKIVRFSAATRDELTGKLQNAIGSVEEIFRRADTFGDSFQTGLPVRLAFVAASPEELRSKIELVQKGGLNAQGDLLAQKGILFGVAKPKGKIAFVFPGHGSEYPGMLRSLVESFPPARRILERFNRDLNALGFPSFQELAWQDPPAIDPFRASELALVTADALVFEVLRVLKITPDVVSAHSFGEYGALYAAGCWTYRELIQAASASSDAHLACTTARGAMLCTNLNEQEAQDICRQIGGEIYVSNVNAPDQTVLAGRIPEIQQAEQRINAQNGRLARMVPVANAIHTILLRDVCQPLADGVSKFPMTSPKIPLLSNIVNDYVTDPATIRYNLGEQVVRPVKYVELIRRLAAENVTAIVECGPNRVLTRLNVKILAENDRVTMVASDSRNNEGLFPLFCVKAALEIHECVDKEASPMDAVSREPSQELEYWARAHRSELLKAARHLADRGGIPPDRREDGGFTPRQWKDLHVLASEIGLLPVTLEAVLEDRHDLKEQVRTMSDDCGTASENVQKFPLIRNVEMIRDGATSTSWIGHGECVFSPASDPFLLDHRFRGRPLLPAVMTMELFAETVRHMSPGKFVAAIRDVEFQQGCSFSTDEPVTMLVRAEIEGDRASCRLVGPRYNGRGKLLEKERIYAVGFVELSDRPPSPSEAVAPGFRFLQGGDRHEIRYLDQNALMYHGPVFQQCTEATFSDEPDACAWLLAHPIERLAGERSAENWILHPATVDACLYVCGVCAWIKTDGALALPKSVGCLRPGRRPHPGERCMAYANGRSSSEMEIRFDILCLGEDEAPLFYVENYCCQIVPSSVKKRGNETRPTVVEC